MGLDLVQRGRPHERVTVTAEVRELAQRVRDGDATVGWMGAEELSVFVNTETGQFEVWGVDDHGGEYLCLEWPRCDASLLRRLAEIDQRHNPLQDRVAKMNAAADRSRQLEDDARFEEMADRLQHGLMADIGRYHGGLSRRLH